MLDKFVLHFFVSSVLNKWLVGDSSEILDSTHPKVGRGGAKKLKCGGGKEREH